MDLWLFYGATAAVLIISFVYALMGQTSDSDYFGNQKTVSFVPLTLTILATQLGGGAMLGCSDAAFRVGPWAILYVVGIALGLWIIAIYLARPLQNLNVATIATAMGQAFSSKFVLKFTSICSIITLFAILTGIASAFRKLLLTLGIDNEIAILGTWGAFLLYTTQGGYRAVVRSDMVQIIYIVAVLILLGWNLATSNLDIAGAIASDAFTHDFPFIDWVVVPTLFIMISQDMGQRCFSAASARTLKTAMITSGFALIGATAVCVLIGMLGKTMNIPMDGQRSILIEVTQLSFPSYVTSLLASAIVMAIVSTADSLLSALTTNIAIDFDIKAMGATKAVSLGAGALAMGLSYINSDIIGMMLLGYELSVMAITVPFVMAFFLRKPNKAAAKAAILLGSLSFIIARACGWSGYQVPALLIIGAIYLYLYGRAQTRVSL